MLRGGLVAGEGVVGGGVAVVEGGRPWHGYARGVHVLMTAFGRPSQQGETFTRRTQYLSVT